jgi:purine catabolism regulator
MLTVQSLLDELDLDLVTGDQAAGSPVRWVHISELEDPTPWLSGGELMLTTGIPLDTAAKQRAFVRLLADRNLAGLGFGTGFSHKKIPKPMVDEARKRDFPLFEVPYSTPFIAVTEKAFARLVNEQYEVLQRGIAVQRRLERLVLEERGLEEIVATISSAVGGSVAILDGRGERLAGRDFRRELSADAFTAIRKEALAHTADGHPFVPAHPSVAGRALAHPVISPGGGPPQAWVVIVRDSGGLGDFERLILQQAVAVVALELMRRRVARETERRLAGDVLAGALGGRLEQSELRRRLEPFGIGDETAVLVFSLDSPSAAEPVLERALAADACPAVVAPHTAGGRELLCAVIDAADRDPLDVAADARKALTIDRGAVRAAASRPAPPEKLRHSFHEARCALEATAFANGGAPDVASWRDLGAFTLLLSISDDEALKLYCESVLGPIEQGDDDDYGGELLRSLEAFIEQNGQWERAAREVFCHRHTLRYRMRKVEELTGRDLSRAHDRIEFWLALRARELIG